MRSKQDEMWQYLLCGMGEEGLEGGGELGRAGGGDR